MAMDLENLSSNWKTLRKTLKSAPEKGKGSKPSSAKSSPIGKPSSKRKAPVPVFKASPRKKSKASHLAHRPSMSSTTATGPSRPEVTQTPAAATASPAAKPKKLGKYLALDCEMVGLGPQDIRHPASQLARASVVDYDGAVIYDTYVLPTAPVTDYRTHVSGIRPHHLKPAPSFAQALSSSTAAAAAAATEDSTTDTDDENNGDSYPGPSGPAIPLSQARARITALLAGRILVGHALANDLAALALAHPPARTRDTARHPPFRARAAGRAPALRKLAAEVLGREIQSARGGHCSVEDARAAMALFRRERAGMEAEARGRFGAAAVVGVDKGGGEGEEGAEGVGEVEVEAEGGEDGEEPIYSEGEEDDDGDALNGVNGGTAKKPVQAKKKKKKKKKRNYR